MNKSILTEDVLDNNGKKMVKEEAYEGESIKETETVTKENIDDLVNKWHESDTEQNIHEYLGLTLEQYFHWVEADELLKA